HATSFYSGLSRVTPRFRSILVSEETSRKTLRSVLEHLCREWRRARDAGFNEMEFAEGRSEVRARIRRQFSSRLSQSAVSTADLLLRGVQYGEVFESPE